MNAPRIGSLCTGYGGLDGAVQAVFGGELAWVADPDLGAAAILAHHHPDVPNLGDITKTNWEDVARVDLLCGGYPCQPFSSAGHQKGVEDERHIWPYIADALRVLRPRYAVFENVANHLRIGFDVVLADLAGLGFDVEWCTVRASEVGAPHRRERLFVVATDADAGGLESERWGSAGLLGSQAAAQPGEGDQRERAGDAARDRGETAANAADHGHERGRLARGRRPGPADSGLPAADADRGGQRQDQCDVQPRESNAGRCAPADTPGDGRDEGRPEPARLVGRSDAALGGTPTPAHPPGHRHGHTGPASVGWIPAAAVPSDPVEWGDYEPAIRRWEHATGRPAPRPTEPGRNGERLSPLFVEWLMGLPAGHVTDVPGLSRNQQLKALGNGVVPQQATAALVHLTERRVAA